MVHGENVNYEPKSTIERIANAALEAATKAAEEKGVTLEMFIAVRGEEGIPKGEMDSTVAAHLQGQPDPADDAAHLISWLLSVVKGTAERAGLKLDLITSDRPIGRG